MRYGLIILTLIVSSFCHPNEVVLGENDVFNSSALAPFLRKLAKLDSTKSGKVSVVHIGDSHIQADFFSGQTRKRLQTRFGNAGRGLVFPYSLAGTSGAIDVKFKSDGVWNHCDIMKGFLNCNLGVSGYSVSCKSETRFVLDVKSKADTDASFNKLSLFSEDTFVIDSETIGAYRDSSDGKEVTILFDELQDSLTLLALTSDNIGQVELQGVVMENQLPGILYNAVGVNGSSTRQYLRSQVFSEQIASLNASLVIISFGTNDCYMSSSKFCIDCVKEGIRNLIVRIRKENPSSAILLTSPPDSYIYRKYANSNIPKLQQAMKELCFEQNVALWDFYGLMGGKNSIKQWQNNGLARRDYIHLTKTGYELQGNLLYEALIKAYDDLNDV